MRVLFLSTNDTLGGAAIAAIRLFRSVASTSGVTAQMLVQSKSGCDPLVIKPESDISKLLSLVRLPFETLLVRRVYRRAQTANFMPSRLPDGLRSRIDAFSPDVLHVHWVGHSFLRPETLSQVSCPIVWTLHDMWALTGGCYYDGGCGKYTTECGECPVLGSTRRIDLSTRVMRRKRSAWRDLDLTIVSPSRWLASCAASSSLHSSRRIEVIPYGLSPEIFQPWPKSEARRMLGLPNGVNLVLFGAAGLSDPRKGFSYLQAALSKLLPSRLNLELVVFGGQLPPASIQELGVKVHSLGRLGDELTAALAYSAADLFVAPSLEDNLPNTVLEASMCGTPVVAFRVGGIPDIVEHKVTGILVEPRSSEDLARAIQSLIEDPDTRARFATSARTKSVQEFAHDLQATRYLSLYSQLLKPAAAA